MALSSPDLKSLTPCNPLSVDIGGSLVKVVYWKRRDSGGVFPPFVRMQEGPGDLPLHPPPSPVVTSRNPTQPPLPQSTLRNSVEPVETLEPLDGSEEKVEKEEKREEKEEEKEKAKPSIPIVNTSHPRVKFSVSSRHFTGELKFFYFSEEYVPEFIKFIKEKNLVESYLPSTRCLHATGGGAYGYKKLIQKELGIKVCQHSEFDTFVKGLTFILNNSENEIFTYENKWSSGVFPYLLVTMGSGVSILKVSSPTSIERVSGTALGGGSFWGLCKLLTDVGNFDELIGLVENGHTANVDLLVGDIYGGSYSSIGLPSDLAASFFGKLQRGGTQEYSTPDVVRSLLAMVTMNVAQITYMCATLYGLKNIFFSGSFLRDHPLIWENLSSAIQYWSSGEVRAMFLLHDGYLGALGALLESSPEDESESEGSEEEEKEEEEEEEKDGSNESCELGSESPDHKRPMLSNSDKSQLKL